MDCRKAVFSLKLISPSMDSVNRSLKPLFVAGLLVVTGQTTFAVAAGNTDSPRQKILMDEGWKFHLGDTPDAGGKFDYPEVKFLEKTHVDEAGLEPYKDLPDPAATNLGGDVSYVQAGFNDADWRGLDLPHDWAVELPFDSKADAMHGF